MHEIISAGVIIYRVHNNTIEYLLLHHIAGHWDFAKGKMEANESKEETALRELHEEAGLRTTLQEGFSDSMTYTFRNREGVLTKKSVFYFLGRVNDEQVVLSHEHKDYVWLAYKDAYTKLTYDNARAVLEKAHAFIKKHDAQ